MKITYLDYNATAPVKPRVIEAMAVALREGGNPSSVHAAGRLARNAVEEARIRLAELLGAAPENIIFTSGGTEANNQAICTAVGIRRVLISAVEHDGVLAAANASGAKVEEIPVNLDGLVDLEALDAMLAAGEGKTLVSIMLANNETGVIQPIAKLAEIAHAHGALLHCDAVQAPGKIAVDFAALGADTMSMAAHKMGGPQGIGALIHRPGLEVRPLIAGGGQERGRRSGTENVAGIVALGVAAELAAGDVEKAPSIAALRDHLEAEVLKVSPDSTIFGVAAPRLPNTANFTMPGVAGETQVMAMDLAGYAISGGSACSSGKVKRSRVLVGMGASDADAVNAIRVSLGPTTSAEDIEGFLAAWTALLRKKGVAAPLEAAE
jgi:cysteine desulfurase